MGRQYIPTGNQMVSLPQICEDNAAIYDVTFLHMGLKGLVDIRGDERDGLIRPYILLDGNEARFTDFVWSRLQYWVPSFCARADIIEATGVILAPVHERGFIYRLTFKNTGKDAVHFTAGLKGCFASVWHCINEEKELDGKKTVYRSGWNQSLVFDFSMGSALFSLASMTSEQCIDEFSLRDGQVDYSLGCGIDLQGGESRTINFYWGLGFEEVASATSSKEMLRQGWDYEYDRTLAWLRERTADFGTELLNNVYHTNLFFNLFYATGITMDTEELVLVTSRSPRYYVSAAYWDRDSLLWSFPSVLDADPAYAKAMLDYVFTRQIRNVGVHSRYIDGTVLEPGFELDELCAPVLALYAYIKNTGDVEYLKERYITQGISHILRVLYSKKHKQLDLFETFLQPTDDMHVYRYLTYDNALVWRILNELCEIFQGILPAAQLEELAQLSERVRNAVYEHCIKQENGKRVFCWSTDLEGHYDIYDEPPGSLQMLAFHSFCLPDDEVFTNTVELIRSKEYKYSFADCNIAEIGCPHAPHPWILSVANSLILGRKEHCLDILSKVSMDNGIACESVNENTGCCTTGAAFATCAGFLSYAIRFAFL